MSGQKIMSDANIGQLKTRKGRSHLRYLRMASAPINVTRILGRVIERTGEDDARSALELPISIPFDLTDYTFDQHRLWYANQSLRADWMHKWRQMVVALSWIHRRAFLITRTLTLSTWHVDGRMLPEEILAHVLYVASPSPAVVVRMPNHADSSMNTPPGSQFSGLLQGLQSFLPGPESVLRDLLQDEWIALTAGIVRIEALRDRVVDAARHMEKVYHSEMAALPIVVLAEDHVSHSVEFQN